MKTDENNSNRRDDSLALILAELEKATRKFPKWPTDPLHALAVLGEEFGELTREMLHMAYEPSKTSHEVIISAFSSMLSLIFLESAVIECSHFFS